MDHLWDGGKRKAWAAAKIVALLEELQGNQPLLDKLTDHGYGEGRNAPFSVSKWLAFWNKGIDIWRIKIWALDDKGIRYRIIYAFNVRARCYHVLAIAPREFDYKADDPLTKRIGVAYESL